MSQTADAWNSGRPIYNRLPGVNGGYFDEESDNPADWLTVFWDELLVASKALVADVRDRQLDPQQCDVEWLDFLAALCGFTEDYWDPTWEESWKRQLISESFTNIWPNKGTQQVLERLLEIFEINASIWQGSRFILGLTTLPGLLGSPEWRYYIRVGLEYERTSQQFKLAQRVNRLFGPAYCESDIVYERFYLGISQIGEPIFEA